MEEDEPRVASKEKIISVLAATFVARWVMSLFVGYFIVGMIRNSLNSVDKPKNNNDIILGDQVGQSFSNESTFLVDVLFFCLGALLIFFLNAAISGTAINYVIPQNKKIQAALVMVFLPLIVFGILIIFIPLMGGNGWNTPILFTLFIDFVGFALLAFNIVSDLPDDRQKPDSGHDLTMSDHIQSRPVEEPKIEANYPIR